MRRYTVLVLEHVGGNKSRADRVLDIDNNTLWRRLKGQGSGSQA